MPSASPGSRPAGNQSAAPGWSWVGERGPELMHLSGGERIMPAHVARGYAEGAGLPSGSDKLIALHVYLDGKEITASVRSHSYQDNVDNGNRRRGGRVAGMLVPR
jgi:phage-related tail protein